jgi:hypothetical protein
MKISKYFLISRADGAASMPAPKQKSDHPAVFLPQSRAIYIYIYCAVRRHLPDNPDTSDRPDHPETKVISSCSFYFKNKVTRKEKPVKQKNLTALLPPVIIFHVVVMLCL